jgi:hypothetical protein
MSKHIVIDEHGNEIDVLEEKNNKIKEELGVAVADFQKQQQYDRTGRRKFGFQLLMQIEDKLGAYGRISADEFVNLTADDIDELWWHFHSLMAYFNRFFEIVPNRQSFMLYARINSRQYKMLCDSEDEDVRSVMSFIEDRLVGKGFSAGESGNANDKAVMNRLRSSGVGHNVTTASEDKVLQAVTNRTPNEMQRELQSILSNEIKQIGKN